MFRYFEVVLVGISSCHYSVLQLAFILNHSCAVVKVQAVRLNCIQVLFPNPESDTDLKRNSSTASDATLCVFVNPRLARLTCSATLSPCFIHPVGGSYGRLTRVISLACHRIDHRMKPSHFCVGLLLRKEVIQPHLPIRLPCYDFTPVIGLALDG